jgi:DNA helicase-2/ATP-dependent DNA helicase PcrA
MNELISAAAQYDRQHPDGDGTLTDWLTQVSLVSDLDAIDPAVGAVTLMTLHAAKGLEFNTVFMAGMEDGLLPHQRSREENGDIEEERRLCFVGMTRAKKALTLSCAKWREIRGMSQRTSQSQFLHELPEDAVTWIDVAEKHEEQYDDRLEDEDSSSEQQWFNGQMVRHKTYGIGQILAIDRSPRGTQARIRFKRVGEKTFVLEFAKELEPIEYMDSE